MQTALESFIDRGAWEAPEVREGFGLLGQLFHAYEKLDAAEVCYRNALELGGGAHTTTFAEMFQVNDNTFIIDTPGVKEWGLVDMNEQEISDYFPEMRDLRLNCKFGSRCIHVTEPGCAIIKAVEDGLVASSRYHSYLSMVSGEDNRK